MQRRIIRNISRKNSKKNTVINFKFYKHLTDRTMCKTGYPLSQLCLIYCDISCTVYSPIYTLNGFTICYTMLKTTLVVRCSRHSLIFFKSNLVWFESPISQYFFVVLLTLWSLLLKRNEYLHWELAIWGKEKYRYIKSNKM